MMNSKGVVKSLILICLVYFNSVSSVEHNVQMVDVPEELSKTNNAGQVHENDYTTSAYTTKAYTTPVYTIEAYTTAGYSKPVYTTAAYAQPEYKVSTVQPNFVNKLLLSKAAVLGLLKAKKLAVGKTAKIIVLAPLAAGLKLGAATALAVPMGVGAVLGAPVGALLGAKVGAIKGALLGKVLFLKKLGLIAAAIKWKVKKAMAPVVLLIGTKKALLAAKAALISQGAKSFKLSSLDMLNNLKPVVPEAHVVQTHMEVPAYTTPEYTTPTYTTPVYSAPPNNYQQNSYKLPLLKLIQKHTSLRIGHRTKRSLDDTETNEITTKLNDLIQTIINTCLPKFSSLDLFNLFDQSFVMSKLNQCIQKEKLLHFQ